MIKIVELVIILLFSNKSSVLEILSFTLQLMKTCKLYQSWRYFQVKFNRSAHNIPEFIIWWILETVQTVTELVCKKLVLQENKCFVLVLILKAETWFQYFFFFISLMVSLNTCFKPTRFMSLSFVIISTCESKLLLSSIYNLMSAFIRY